MTVTDERIGTAPKPRYMPQAKRRQLIHELALGELPYRQLASKFGITHSYLKQFASENKEEINELRDMAEEKQRELWAMNPFYRALERVTDIDDVNEEINHVRAARAAFMQQMGVESEPINDLYIKLMELKHKLLKQLEESSGQLPTRVSAPPANQGKATIEVVGVPLEDVAKNWEQGSVEVPR